MNRETAPSYLPLVQALAEGKTIQTGSELDGWKDCPRPTFNDEPNHYRIKPEPRRWWLVVCPTAQDVGSFYSVRERADGNAKFYQHDLVEVVEVIKP